ncbi:tyrosine-type recombinase/integrase [Ancylobacter sp. WKF20]|uniref:tyrosine-type recombinase/integrase n=1 Tax=Ancylobacter sp. WKF20 TaxID=3039801 RepID=UPI0024343AA3|nr:tyrosine-type recombinase/integrase [Ancylobacter sp. WKF20]WGD29594.1 tyrosine-type recombinase/integrase [Ancylobacter sp. WKF20]
MRRSDTRNPQFVLRIPKDLKASLVGMTLEVPRGDGFVSIRVSEKTQSIRFSLGTSEPTEAKQRQAVAVAHLERVFSALRSDTLVHLTHKQTLALAGEAYRLLVERHEDNPGPIELWDMAMIVNATALAGQPIGLDWPLRIETKEERQLRALEQRFGAVADQVLGRNGLVVDQKSRAELLFQVGLAYNQATVQLSNNAGGDYSPDPKAERFGPSFKPSEQPSTPSPARASAVPMRRLFEEWWREAKLAGRSVSTKDGYGTALERLITFIGHDDAARVSAEDIVRFKDHMVSTPSPTTGKPLSAKTIKDSYLAGLKSIFGWAVDNLKLTENPAEKVTMKSARKQKVRQPWFTEEEASLILSAALNAKKEPGKPPQRFALSRWVPWLCAYTGARVGEMVQLRKQDVWRDGECWVMTITPEAVTVKSRQMRTVPLHPHLIELGFVEFVQSAPAGFLFMWSGTERASWQYAKRVITDEVRKVVTDPNVQPNHGWRHTFKALGGEVGIEQRTLDAIQGHAPRTEGETYGGVTIKAMSIALGRFPKFSTKEPAVQSN